MSKLLVTHYAVKDHKCIAFSAIIIGDLLLFSSIFNNRFYVISCHKFINKASFILFTWTVTIIYIFEYDKEL